MEVWKSALAILLLSLFYAYVHASAPIVSAPDSINIQGNDFFLVDVYNSSTTTQPLSVAFYSPVTATITKPTALSPQSHATIKIALNDATYKTPTQITGKLVVSVGAANDSKEITLNYTPKVNVTNQLAGMFGAFFTMGTLVPEFSSFSLFEWVLFWIFVIVAAILLIAFIARIARRT